MIKSELQRIAFAAPRRIVALNDVGAGGARNFRSLVRAIVGDDEHSVIAAQLALYV